MIYLHRLNGKGCDRMNMLYPKIEGYLRPINDADKECSGKLVDYYIKTAYNACSSGDYRNDYVDICNLKAIIKQGVRCLDFEIYSIQNRPVVATSTSDNFHIKETFNSIPFNSVMDTIRNYAFSGGTCPNPTDPVLIHLRCKSTNRKMYTKLAQIFKANADVLLGAGFSYHSKGDTLGKTPLLSLRGKIIIIMERTNNAFFHNQPLMEFVNMVSNSTFMRKYRFQEIEDGHDKRELIQFNRAGMTIVLPNKGDNPGNPDSKLCRENGCQLVAMRYQMTDDALSKNTTFFNRKGYAFVLKPENQRDKPRTSPP
ncbi:MAG: phosphatidylinositol-specific phospholipase C domain-containing protein [Flavobacterium sp.]